MPTIDELLAVIADRQAPIAARVAAGDALGALGDPRLDGGRVILADAGAAMARDLVTVGEFRAFVDAGGYDDAGHWSRAGWAWRCKQHVDGPRFWDEPQWAAYLVPNHPVVGVSAFEAEAYAAFREARLPSEREWDAACRAGASGADGRAYPWGNDWDDDACAHRDYGPRCTLAAGICPRGTGPSGIRDLCGNVWQWTSDERPDGARVVCGGAWNNLPWMIGCGARNGYAPDARFSNLGFRLAFDP